MIVGYIESSRFERINKPSKVVKLNSRFKCLLLVCLILVVIIGLSILCWAISINRVGETVVPENPNVTKCEIQQKQNMTSYPVTSDNSKIVYFVSFNSTTMQANYVKYIQPSITNPCKQCSYFKKDPYDIDDLRHEDYTNTGYDRGHLVPNADYGTDTYFISNAVPMVPAFNRGMWRISEQMIRDKYKGKLIYKGCEYSDKYLMSQRNKKLYIPTGCSYIVFNSSDINQTIGLKILDYGYLENKNETSLVKRIPEWFECSDSADVKRMPLLNQNAQKINDDLVSNNIECSSTFGMRGNHLLSYGPGDYKLSPRDYYCVENLIVEMWGAGGCGGSGINGGDGAYVKTAIRTRMQNIIIHVGYGGTGHMFYNRTGMYGYGYCNTTTESDQNSWILIDQKSPTDDVLKLIAGGGSTGCSINTSSIAGKGGNVTVKNLHNVIAISGNDGRYYSNNPKNIGSKLPGIGGLTYYYDGPNMSWYVPLLKGNDGMINIYFTV